MESEYSAITVAMFQIQISMPKVKQSHIEKDQYLYEIDVATRWGKWHLEKKYSEFQELHKYLNK